jgi:hypothetical protein
MLSTGLEYLCTELECFLQGWNAFYRVLMLSTGLECFRQSWNTFVQSQNVMYRLGIHSTDLEYLCTELECFLQGWNTFVQRWNVF